MKASATKLNRRPVVGGSLIFQITLPESVGRRLEQAAYDEQRTPTNMVAWIVARYLDEQGVTTPAFSTVLMDAAVQRREDLRLNKSAVEDPNDVDW